MQRNASLTALVALGAFACSDGSLGSGPGQTSSSPMDGTGGSGADGAQTETPARFRVCHSMEHLSTLGSFG